MLVHQRVPIYLLNMVNAPLRKLPTHRKLPCISLGAGGELDPRQLEIATAVWQKTLRFLMDSKPQRRY